MLIRERYNTDSLTITTSGNTSWSISQNKSGYTPVMVNLFRQYSWDTTFGAESISYSNGSFSCNGYIRLNGSTGATSREVTIYADVLWKKN